MHPRCTARIAPFCSGVALLLHLAMASRFLFFSAARCAFVWFVQLRALLSRALVFLRSMIAVSSTFSPTVAPAIVIAVARGQGAVPAGAVALARFAKDAMSQAAAPLLHTHKGACAPVVGNHGGFEPGGRTAVGVLGQLKLRPALAQR